MQITELLIPEQIAVGAVAGSKKRVLERLSELLARGTDDLDSTDVFDCLLARERLGSTGLGDGIAIPHARMAGNQHTLAAFVRLDQGIDFDALDQQPVDLFCALLVPEESAQIHVQLLAQLAEMFRDPELCTRLRQAKDPHNLLEVLKEWEQTSAPTGIVD
ncbi:PTS IIA-like nitrogen-regulatory protein PtsN [Nitrosococcus halophilus Nc 4]|uniref:PTS IIA-like nitrogen-regulatory protein PtsN n=1 Tax=Nitrosococcus halophilus (strain Nc4) TaxID=472759 RepID=D5BUX8_NITHN|nr:PTS IIA-like nitrogen regulatory protein PtsN [Nitrosococcus halophilus]ADE13528.1 PTS IIA-like nitrogen-regulatory protein PtsN [Nitrosococcus halophilus Nc 4]